jgi:hypothetical protein
MKSDLRKRFDELCAEIRSYPTPLARCDEQLGHLLEEKSALFLKLEALEEEGTCNPLALWVNDGGFHAA